MAGRASIQEVLGEVRLRLQAGEVLRTLDVSAGTANDDLLCHWLGKIGLGISRDELESLRDRLEREGLTRSEIVRDVRVVSVTSVGREVTSGLVCIDWIERP